MYKESFPGTVATKKYHGKRAFHKGCFGKAKPTHYSAEEMDALHKARESRRKGHKEPV